MKRSIHLSLMIIFLVLFIQAGGEQKVDRIIARYVEKIGGQKALDAIHTLSYTYEMNHLDEKKVMTRKIFQQRPDRLRFEYESGDILLAVGNRYYRGKKQKDSTELKWQTGNYPSDTHILYRLGAFLDHKKRNLNVGYSREAIIGGRPVDVLTVRDGKREHSYYFDQADGLLVIFKPSQRVIVKVGGYKTINNILFPTRTEGTGAFPDGRKWHHINTMKNIVVNPKLDDQLFQPPRIK